MRVKFVLIPGAVKPGLACSEYYDKCQIQSLKQADPFYYRPFYVCV